MFDRQGTRIVLHRLSTFKTNVHPENERLKDIGHVDIHIDIQHRTESGVENSSGSGIADDDLDDDKGNIRQKLYRR